MQSSLRLLPLTLLPLCFAACSTSSDKSKDPAVSSATSPQVMDGLAAFRRASREAEGNSSVGATVVQSGSNMQDIPVGGGGYTKDEIVWTDADNSDTDIPNLDELTRDAKKVEPPWKMSDTSAIRESKRTGKPLVIWFTDSQTPQTDKPIAAELFNRSDFEKWALEETVRLRVDQTPAAVGAGGVTMGQAAERRNYVRMLKDRYKVMGFPTVLVITPTGEVISRIKGFRKGQGDYKWGQIKQGVILAKESYQKTRSDLEKKGYREWSDGKGKSVLAKLTAYRDGDMILVEPDGQKFRTKESHLSDDDLDWLRKEKEKRGIR